MEPVTSLSDRYRLLIICRADCHANLWLSGNYNYQRNPYHNTITIKGLISGCIMILSAFPNEMNFVDFIMTRVPVKIPIPNITTLSNISFAIILTNIFAKQKTSLFSYFDNFDKKKASEWYYRRKSTGTKNIKTIVIDSWKHYHDSSIMAVTIMMHWYSDVSLHPQLYVCRVPNIINFTLLQGMCVGGGGGGGGRQKLSSLYNPMLFSWKKNVIIFYFLMKTYWYNYRYQY